MLETMKLGAQAFLFLAVALIIDLWALSGTLSGVLALLAGVLAALIVAIIWMVGYSCRHDQQRLADMFGGSVSILLVLITGFVFLQGCVLLLVAARAYQAGMTNLRVGFEFVVGGFIAFSSAVAIGKSVGTIAQKLTQTTIGTVVTPETQPALWAFVRSIAETIGAVPPKQIILGLDPTFYATAADITLLGAKRATAEVTEASNQTTIESHSISGETMFLSLPLMRLLSKGQLSAVIGHELGHFKGLDTVYTLEFVPVYRGVMHALNVTSAVSGESVYGRMITSPATTILKFYLSEFIKTEREISRERELEADKSGAIASSPDDLVAALVKVGAFAPIWPQLCNHAASIVKDGKMYGNLSTAFAHHAGDVRSTVEPAKLGEMALASRQTHPTDTHPPLETRARALGVEAFDFDKLTKIEDEPVSALIVDAEAIEHSLSVLLQQFFVANDGPKTMGEAISKREEPDD